MRHSPLVPPVGNPAGDTAPTLMPLAGPITRRRFITYCTAGATSLVVQGCGGGGANAAPVTSATSGGSSLPPTTPSTPTPTPVAPIWSTVPTLVFTQGVAASISVAQYVSSSSSAALVLTLNSILLPAGVSFNAAAMRFDYDGAGALVISDGHVLAAVG